MYWKGRGNQEKRLELWYNFIDSTTPYDTNYLIYSKDRFSHLTCVQLSWTVKSNRISSGIDLVLLSMLYKFIIWAAGVWAQSGFGTNLISVLTPYNCLFSVLLISINFFHICFSFNFVFWYCPKYKSWPASFVIIGPYPFISWAVIA